MVKISIIIPVYNSEKYLKKCLESISNQTLPDIEIICIDDGSTDTSLEIIEEYSKKDNRFIVLKQDTNNGQGIARNIALDNAKGEYIMFVDSDDWIEKCACEILYNQAKSNNNDLVLFNYYLFEEKENEYIKCSSRIEAFDNMNNSQIQLVKNKKNFFTNTLICVQMFKRDLIEKFRIRFSEHRNCEDDIFVVKAFLNSKSASVVEDFLYYYRIHLDSTYQTTKTIINVVDTKRLSYEEVKKDFNSTEIMDFYLEYCINSLIVTYDKFTKRDKKIKKDFYNEIQKFFNQINNEQNIDKIKYNINYSKFKHITSDSYFKYMLLQFIKKIFSIENEKHNNKKYKVITVLGIKIKIRKDGT